MKRALFIIVLPISLLFSSSIFSQNGTIVYDSFYSPSLSRTIPLAIYLPPGHSTSTDPYRNYIFLHGGGGSTYTSHINTISSALNSLINDTTINFEPMVVICPGITWSGLGGGLNWLNIHGYSDSYLTGNYESVISTDLVNWIDSCQYNLSTERYRRAIGGFSMGVHCVQIALRNPDEFCAFTSHCGYTSIKAFEEEVPLLLASYSSGPPYTFDPGNDFYSLFWFAYSAAWSPDTLEPNQPIWQVDFPINAQTGELIPDIFDSIWVKNNHPTCIMQNPTVYTDTVHMYFDTRAGDGNRIYNERFHSELDSLNIDHMFNFFPTGSHQYSLDQAESGFMFLDSVMDAEDPFLPAFADNIVLSHNFINKGIDTLSMTAKVYNPHKHIIELFAMFESLDGSFIDSLIMYDDGLHNDSTANDGIYGNSMLAPMLEQEFKVGLKTIDIDVTANTYYDDLDRFTTIGPISVTNCTEVQRISRNIYYQLELLNIGNTTTAQNVKAIISISDPYVRGISNEFLNFGNIGAGQIVTSQDNFMVNTYSNLPNNHTFVFYVEMLSNDRLFWTDSTSVVVLGISESEGQVPTVFALKQNYPNPFNPSTTIDFSLPKAEFVELRIFDVNGKEIQTLISDNMTSGTYQYEWQDTESLSSGIYYYSIKAGEFTSTKKLVLLK